MASNTRDASGVNLGDTSHAPTWIGDFSGSGNSEVLLYTAPIRQWWLAQWDRLSAQFDWAVVSNTRDASGVDLGDTSRDPTWIGDFTGSGNSEVLLYTSRDGCWWLAQWDAGSDQFDWRVVSRTRERRGVNLGDSSHDPTRIGDFTGSGRSEVLLYTPSSDQWWLSQWNGDAGQFDWKVVSRTRDPRGINLGDTSHDPTPVGDFIDLCEQLGTLPVAGWNVEQYWSNKQKSCVR